MTTLAKGTTMIATVEEALDNCVMVRVKHESRTFRGILLDESNSFISRTPKRGGVEKTQVTSDFTPRERSSVVLLESSPRRTANSKRSGLSQRLVLLRQQEEGSEPTIVNSYPTDGVRGFVNARAPRSKLAAGQSQKKRKRAKPPKAAKGSTSKAKDNMQTTSGVKRKKSIPKDCVRPLKKSKGPTDVRTLYSQSEIQRSGIVLTPCLVKVCPIIKKPGILNQSSTTTKVQTLPVPESHLKFVIQEVVARSFKSEGQNVQTQTVTKPPEVRRVAVDLEQMPKSNKGSDTVSLLSEENIGRQSNSEGQNVQIPTLTKPLEVRRVAVDLEQMSTSSTVVNTASDTESLLSEENIGRKSNSEGQNVQMPTLTKPLEGRRVAVDLEQMFTSSTVVNTGSDTVSLLSEENIGRQSNNEGQNVQIPTLTKPLEARRVAVDLEQMCTSSTVVNTGSDTVSLLSEENIGRQSNNEGRHVQIPTLIKPVEVRRVAVDLEQMSTSSSLIVNTGSDTESCSSKENIARESSSEGQNAQTQAVTKMPEVRRLSSDLEQLPMSNSVANESEFDSVSLLSEGISIIDVEKLLATDISDEETDSATSFIDKGTSGKKTDVVTAATNQHEDLETVGILNEEKVDTTTRFVGNVERTENVSGEIAIGDRPGESDDIGENTSAVVNDATRSQGAEMGICQNTLQSNNKVFSKLSNRSANVQTGPKTLPTEVVPQKSIKRKCLQRHSESPTSMLSVVVKLPLIRMKTRVATSTPKLAMQSDIGCKSPRFSVDDIVWGKLQGSPWWPGKVFALSGSIDEFGSTSAKDACITWFGSNTRSVLPVMCLSPFVADFHIRHLPHEEGWYRIAVQEAIKAHRDGTKD